MEKNKLNWLIRNLPVPEPSENAREKTLQAALAEFRRQKLEDEKNLKGFSALRRLRGKLPKGGPAMRKSFAYSVGLAFCLLIAVALTLPNFISYRQRSTSIKRPEMPPVATVAPQPSAPAKMFEKKVPVTGRDEVSPSGKYRKPALQPAEEFGGVAPAPRPAAPDKLAAKGRFADKEGRLQPPDQTYVGRDRFEAVSPNPVKKVSEAPVSTFSIDVDTASYAFVRRALNSGVLPQKHAVRIEELINYFDYDYPLPADRGVPFKPTVAVFPTPWNADTQLLHIGIKGFNIDPVKKPRSNLVFLIDVSGSMRSPDKLPLLKNAFRMLVETLDPTDRVAVVVYAGAAGTVLEPTPVKEKGKILAVLDRLSAGGATAGGEGIRQAYALAEANYDRQGVNRVILATDGDFNVGIRNPEELKGFVERKRQSGVYLTVLGFGRGNYNDALMQKLAQNGNGIAAYIDTLNEARKVLVQEAGANLFPIAQDVKIQIEFNPARVAEYRLIGYETRLLKREDFNNDRVDAGDVGAGHSVTAIYEITPVGSKARLIDELRYGSRKAADNIRPAGKRDEYAFLKIRYKLPGESKSRLMTMPIGRESEYPAVENIPGNEVRFATAVAAFGQLLRGDPYVQPLTYDDVIALAESARGRDRFGYRAEFLNLVRLAKTARALGDN